MSGVPLRNRRLKYDGTLMHLRNRKDGVRSLSLSARGRPSGLSRPPPEIDDVTSNPSSSTHVVHVSAAARRGALHTGNSRRICGDPTAISTLTETAELQTTRSGPNRRCLFAASPGNSLLLTQSLTNPQPWRYGLPTLHWPRKLRRSSMAAAGGQRLQSATSGLSFHRPNTHARRKAQAFLSVVCSGYCG